MSYESISTLTEEKRQAKRNARQLGYTSRFPNLEDKINCARSVPEIYRILNSVCKAM